MEALRINKFEASYHLPLSSSEMQKRLDGLLREVLDEALELALEHAGVSPRDEICLREIHAPVRLLLSASDRLLITRWSEALASYIHRAIQSGNIGNVIRYSSRLHGLVDFATGVASGDYSRAWAWNQLGFAHLSDDATDAEAAAQFMKAMVVENRSVVPVLKVMAETDQLHRLAGRFDSEVWRYLSAAALATVGIEPMEDSDIEPDLNRIDASSEMTETARVLAQSSIAHALIKYRRDFVKAGVSRSSLAALITLEAEPDLFRRSGEMILLLMRNLSNVLKACMEDNGWSSTSNVLERTEYRLERRGDTRTARSENIPLLAADEVNETGVKQELSRQNTLPHSDQNGCFGASTQSLVAQSMAKGIETLGFQKTIRLDDQVNNVQNACPADEESPRLADSLQTGYPLPEIQQTGQTAYGGLLFLLSLIDALGLDDKLPNDSRFKQRSLRWILHSLALQLTACKETDPAALAFCGLAPETELPWWDEPRADAQEQEALGEAAGRIVAELRECLGWDDRNLDRLIDYVCHRRARIHAEPGWLEVVLALEEVSTDIRRAGLDLDPGYLPWLGVVVKFRYE